MPRTSNSIYACVIRFLLSQKHIRQTRTDRTLQDGEEPSKYCFPSSPSLVRVVPDFIIHPCDPTVVICYLIWPCDIAVRITYLISHRLSLSYNTAIKEYF